MKKTYIAPSVIAINSNLDHSFCKASINNGGELTPSGNVGESDTSFDVGAKSGNTSPWDDDEEDED